jgi:hypothetical protein
LYGFISKPLNRESAKSLIDILSTWQYQNTQSINHQEENDILSKEES